MFKRMAKCVWLLCFLAYFSVLFTHNVHAEVIKSNTYQLEESSIGVEDSNQSSSLNYKTDVATGALSIGNSASTNYQIENGTKTTKDPTLSFTLNGSNVNFGSFSTASATTSTATFTISNYTSYGYVAQIVGKAPSNNNHTIAAMGATEASQTGTEQFGINLVANTVPNSIGANPDQGQFGFGTAAPNYSTPNKYRFVSGETIAMAAKSSGVTTYTITYLVNVDSLTPGGKYTSDQTIVVTGTY